MDPLGSEVKRELARFGPQSGMGDVVAAWTDAVGAGIARNAWPARIQRDGTLIVHAADAVWAFELGHRAAEIAARLPNVERIRFVPGPLPEAAADDPQARAAPLARPTAAQAAQAESWAAEIEDGELRERVAAAAAASLARGSADRPF
jgi:hypothetical protein